MKAQPAGEEGPCDIRYFALSAAEVGRLRIPSGFETDSVHELHRSEDEDDLRWHLVSRKVETFRKSYDDGDPREWLEPYYEQIDAGRVRFLAASRGLEPEGLLTYCQVDWNDTLWLLDIRVSESERRSGLGSGLLRELQTIARQKRVRGISVETQINNVPAIHLYRRCGFRVSGFNDHLYENDDAERQDVAVFLFWETS
ncbi:MAG TPA: hypothetical protein DEV93_22820 [Chloroflexi bacterium]|nr:hypothetical protein [Chloroflexota bacterium]